MVNTLLRPRDGSHASVSFSELLFDLIYVFAVTQLSHYLLHHLTLTGVFESLVLWFAVWLAWQYTAWVTNWFDPETRQVRLLLFAIMLTGLFATSAIPDAFGERGLAFAVAFSVIQIGRTLVVLFFLGREDPLRNNFLRILGWLSLSAVFWISGGIADHQVRLILWSVAVSCEYIAPMSGFYLPVLGRSVSYHEWIIDGHHLAERCQLFVIVALGETILSAGSMLSEQSTWGGPVIIAVLVAFAGCLAMWWLYFDTSSKAGSQAIAAAQNPGRMGAWFHYVHVVLVGAIVLYAVASELVIASPAAHTTLPAAAILTGGPVVYVSANAVYKRIIYGRFPLSHITGLAAFIVLIPILLVTNLLIASVLTTGVLIATGVQETYSRLRYLRREYRNN
ncbi:low temperature requirement protein A [Klebsiella aerogenes]|uniref:low temperature requirement protein A n=1 Tax=Klebsiella aerogenes TaxID=548 RepID=UPI001F342F12|nr:low temperature requirement protein A [Klebsiella aerogenes]